MDLTAIWGHSVPQTGYHRYVFPNACLDAWRVRITRPIFRRRREQRGTQVAHEGSADGPLYRETIVFTGALSEPRRELVRQAVDWGCDYKTGMSKKVTMLVVGTQDERRQRNHGSSKHRRADDLIRNGHDIRVLTEADFWHLKETVNL